MEKNTGRSVRETLREVETVQLLVSVVHEEEVAAAVAGGADIIDVKNPREGSLGANFPHVIRRIRRSTPPHLPVSVAIGDMPNLPGTAALAAAGAATCGVQYVKVGLFGAREPDEARALLAAVCQATREQDETVRVIATAYADAQAVDSLPPRELPAIAVQAGAYGCMLDTARKRDVTLFTALSPAELDSFVGECRAAGLICALAGSLREADIPHICDLRPDIIGFRGAACRGDRASGRVDVHAVERLKALIADAGCRSSDLSPGVQPAVQAAPR